MEGQQRPGEHHAPLEVFKAGVSLNYEFQSDPFLQAAGMQSLAWAEHSPGRTSRPWTDTTMVHHHKMCKPETVTGHARGRWCQATPRLAQSTSRYLRAGTKIQLPPQLSFYLKEMRKCSAQNLLSSAPFRLEAEEAFAE